MVYVFVFVKFWATVLVPKGKGNNCQRDVTALGQVEASILLNGHCFPSCLHVLRINALGVL